MCHSNPSNIPFIKGTEHAAPERRGVAMLLVLISMMTATILTVAYLASRDNSAVIGENVARSAAARWAAESGLEVGAAVLQTRTDWRNSHTNGKLVDDLALSGGSVDIDVMDLGTGMPPTDTTQNVQMTSTAVVDGVQQVSTAIAWVPPVMSSVDVDLSEFALFGSSLVELSGDSTVMRWPNAPLSTLGLPIAIGTRGSTASTITVSNNAAVIDGRVFSGPNPSNSLVSISNGTKVPVNPLKDVMPMPKTPSSGVSDPPLINLSPKLDLSGGTSSQNTDRRVSDAVLSNSVRTLRGNISLVSDKDLKLTNNSKLLIDGDVRIVAFEDLVLDTGSSIELKPGASLTLYVGDQIAMDDSYMGDMRSTAVRDNTGKAAYMDPERMIVYRLPTRTTQTDWVIDGNSVVKGSMYGKDVRVRIRDSSALYGRVAATEIRIDGQGAVFYDHQLDSRSGFTTPESTVFNADRTIKTEIKTLVSLDSSSLQVTADLLGINIKLPYSRTSLVESTTAVDDTPAAVGPAQPTPRPVHISWQMTSYGSSMDAWELADAGSGADDVPPTLDAVGP